MAQHNDPIPGLHPFFGLLLSGILLAVSYISPLISTAHQWEFPIWLMQGSQLLAWWAVGITAVITVLNYFGIKLNQFKKKKK